MVDDQVLVNTADIIIEGEVTSRGPALYSSMPATEYTVTSLPIILFNFRWISLKYSKAKV
jgi:hypothetical protein